MGVISVFTVFAVALGVYAADMREMTMRIPLMSKAPVVDGIVGENEWRGASGSFGFVLFGGAGDTIEPVGSAFLVGRTADRLFFAGIGHVGPYGLLRNVKARRGNVGCSGDDTYEIVLVPDASVQVPDVRHVIVNFNGAYCTQALVGGQMEAWLPETMVTRASILVSSWDAFSLSVKE